VREKSNGNPEMDAVKMAGFAGGERGIPVSVLKII
jgi:hypothetical protein